MSSSEDQTAAVAPAAEEVKKEHREKEHREKESREKESREKESREKVAMLQVTVHSQDGASVSAGHRRGALLAGVLCRGGVWSASCFAVPCRR